MTSANFRIITSDTQGSYKDRGSKFFSFAYHVASEAEIKAKLLLLKKRYHDARHHCYAFRLGYSDIQYRVNDDGEPSGTAGKPIFNQIESYGLTDILLVVVRYFGGKLLGTSGLIKAYRSAAVDCLSHATIIEYKQEIIFEISFPYKNINSVMRILNSTSHLILEQDFNLGCRMKIRTDKTTYERIMQKLNKLSDLKTNILEK